MGTQDIAVINRKYSAPTFGFASRNFYVSFLAALEVEQNAEKYFGPVKRDPPRNDLIIESPDFISAATFARAFGVSEEILRSNNPALLNPVWDGKKYIPRGFTLRVPAALVSVTESQVMAALPAGQRYARQTPDAYHKVGRGESLSVIAARYDTTARELVALNGLTSQHRIRAGQNLRLPSSGAASVTQVAAANDAETYTVRKGDSLSTIAARAGVSESALLSRNGLRDKNRIKIGQVLYLQPADSAPVETIAAAAPVAEPASPSVAAASVSASSVETVAQADAKAAEKTPAKVTVAAAASNVAVGTVAGAAVELVEKAPATAAVVATTATAAVSPVAPAEEEGTERADADAEDLTELAGITQAQAEYAATASLADPNDYSVAADGTIEIQATETLGHYADWLALKTQRLRDINRLRDSAQLVVGRRIKLDFSHSDKANFEARRIAHHREIQEAFFIRYRVTATTEHKLQAGESVWEIMQGANNVPVWLLRQYNPDLDFGRVKPGMSIIVPKVQPVARGANIRNSRVSAG
jgi:membrane-bound lytic murein transglycosylase D